MPIMLPELIVGQGRKLGGIRITTPIIRMMEHSLEGPLWDAMFNGRLWPVSAVQRCCRQAAVEV